MSNMPDVPDAGYVAALAGFRGMTPRRLRTLLDHLAPRDATDAVVAPTGEALAFQLVTQQAAGWRGERCEPVEERSRQLGIEDTTAFHRDQPCSFDPGRDHRRRLTSLSGEQFVDVGTLDRDAQVEAVEQRPG